MASGTGYPFVHGLWPFANCTTLKPLELGIHPAFMSASYPAYPVPPMHAHVMPPFHPGIRSKADSFTIDAILNRDSVCERQDKSKSPAVSDSGHIKKDSTHRRHQRLLESSHPYLAPSPNSKGNSETTEKTSPAGSPRGKYIILIYTWVFIY